MQWSESIERAPTRVVTRHSTRVPDQLPPPRKRKQSSKPIECETSFDSKLSQSSQDASRRVALSWRDVTVRVASTSSRGGVPPDGNILQRVSGYVRPGRILAIMGASGTGKTTLLNVLTGRTDPELEVQGDVQLGGVSAQSEQLKRVSAYVSQTDILHPYLTPREHLTFHARCRLTGPDVTAYDRIMRVEQVILQFNLTNCADCLIGSPTVQKTLSGGEKKRVCFATEILLEPEFLVCDEPTTGLDSFMAEMIVNVLRKMTDDGKTAITTIHQPSSSVFNMVDDLMLLCDGRVAWMGTRTDAEHFFNALGLYCPLDFTPADHYICTLVTYEGITSENQSVSPAQVCDAFERSSHSDAVQTAIKQGQRQRLSTRHKEEGNRTKRHKEEGSRPKLPWLSELYILTWRAMHVMHRDTSMGKWSIFILIVYATFYSIIFFNQPYNEVGARNLSGLLYQLMSITLSDNLDAYSSKLPLEFPVYRKDVDSQLYGPVSYFLATGIAEFPRLSCMVFLETVVIYWSSGLYRNFWTYLQNYIILVLVGMNGSSFGYFFTFVSPNMDVTIMMKRGIIVPTIMLAGFFVNIDGGGAKWAKYLSFEYYSGSNININQWTNIDYIECANISIPCFNDGADVLDFYGYDPAGYVFNFVMLFVYMLIVRFAALIALIIRTKYRWI